METSHEPAHGQRSDQAALWNGAAGQAWVDAQAIIDDLLRPFEEMLVEAVRAGPGRRVLDVGCGTGATTLAIARLVGADGRCVGIDISGPMTAVARARAERESSLATFVCADAQSHPFAPASFDMIVSRFGVMFFSDPVRAFANLRRAASEAAALQCLVWRGVEENPFMTTAERAAAPLLPGLPPRKPGAPGQFALADRDRVSEILEASGWEGIDIRPVDVPCVFPEPALAGYVSRMGPVGQALQGADDRTRETVLRTVLEAFKPYLRDGQVRYTSACWMVGARAVGHLNKMP